MLTLRRILGLALFGTAAWLGTVLAANSGSSTALAVGTVVCAIILLIAARHRLGADGGWLMPLAIASLSGLAFLVPGRGDIAPSGAAASRPFEAGKVDWQPFAPGEIQRIVAEGKIVFVNVTADWCITCRVNERLVLGRDPVQSVLAGSDVITMQADWTKPDEAIARYLSRFGRYGIPFDAVYGPSLQQGEALPELLTAEIVLAALERARGEPRTAPGRTP
jgi:suppressor for copper-sensitivity B